MAENAKKEKYFEAVGRRKTSIARVRIVPVEAEKNTLMINGKEIEKYFLTSEQRNIVFSIFKEVGSFDRKFKISVKVSGGGIHSQAEAIRHGIARSLVEYDNQLRKPLKALSYLTRDSRAKERRKFGLKKARKAPQWSKR